MRAAGAAGRGAARVPVAGAHGGRRAAIAAALLCALLALPGAALGEEAAEQDAGAADAAIEAGIEEVLGGLDFSGMEEVTLPAGGERVGVAEAVRRFASGETFSVTEAVSAVLGDFFGELASLGPLLLAIMTPVLLASLLTHLLIGEDDALASLARSACFVLVLVPAVSLTIRELGHTKETIIAMTTRMDRMLPMLLTLLTAVGGSASSAFLHPVVAAASGSMVFLAREVILRLVMCTCAVTAVNHLSDRMHLTRLAQLLRSAVCWLLGVSFTVFVGASSVQGVCSASVDGVAIRAAKYAVDNFVPVVGGMFSDTMDTLVGCTLIVKNALGVASMLALCGALAAPLLRTLAAVFALKLSAALLEPIADAEIVRAIGDFSRTIVLLLITMLCVGTMYFLLIVQLLLVGNLTVMLR
ncbi:MAG: stage III sporulation protein AE [Clostridiales bacterium]|nr:stage III sporulation protein AE [Clostridiales bacterium]